MSKELKPCPFCGGYAEIVVLKKGFKSIIYCTTPDVALCGTATTTETRTKTPRGDL